MEDLLLKINSSFPDIWIQKAELISEWYDNEVLIINDEIVFRFTKKWVNFRNEVDFLIEFLKVSNLCIPNPEYLSENLDFMWYDLIKWKQLKPDLTNSLDDDILDRLSSEIAEFLFLLHNFKYDKKSLVFPKYDKTQIFLEKIDSKISDIDILELKEFYKQILHDYKEFDWKDQQPTLIHNDFYSRNIFIDSEFQNISWIIDFSDMAIADPSIDFMFLYFESKEFTKKIIDKYNWLSWFVIDQKRVELYARIFALNEYFWPDSHNKRIADKWIFG